MAAVLVPVLISWISFFGFTKGQFNGIGVQFQYKPFCHQFYTDSQAKTPLQVTVFEDAAVGKVLKTFVKPTIKAHFRVVGGALQFFHFDINKLELSVRRPLTSLRGQTVHLNISCIETLSPYEIKLPFSPIFMITVRDVNDPPVFVNLPGTVATEEAVPHQRIIYKAVGDDPFDVDDLFKRKTYRLVNVTAVGTDDHASRKFVVDRQGNVLVNGGLDYDDGPRQYNLLIEVIDGGSPPLRNQSVLTVLLEDSDDKGPAFQYQDYTASVVGEKPVAEVECQVTVPPLFATDQDPVKKSPINYRIISGTPGDYRYWSTFFYVDNDSGRLCQTESVPRATSRASRRLERKGFHNFTFTVQAYQTDDHRKAATTKLFVHVQDRNAHSPEFRRLLYRTSVPEYPAIRRGHVILTVQATDADYGLNKLLKYELVTNPNRTFSIDAHTGLVRVMRPKYIDREANGTMEISVRAVETHTQERLESKHPAKIELSLLDVNDNPPTFGQEKYEYLVKDNHPVGMAINNASNKVEASDLDLKENGTVTYTIGQVTNSFGRFSIKDLNRFVVDASGNIRIGRSLRDLRRNRELPHYTIRVIAEDQAKVKSERLSSTTTVIIRIVEANDYPPRFGKIPTSVVIGESADPGTLIANMKALDRDGDEDMYLRYQIAEGNIDGGFSISNRGYLVTARPLDREKTAVYTLVVQVTDRVHTVNATIVVHLKDENDHAPVFQKSRYDLEIPENVVSRYRIGEVAAMDPDEGVNGRVSYRLVGGDMPHLFLISPNGTLYLARRDRAIDRETRDKFIVTVEASDGGTPPKTNITEVNVHLIDVNDNTPQFVRSTYRASVEEGPNAKRLKMLGVIRARDNDKTVQNRNIRFSLSGLGHEVFEINVVSGRLRVKSPGKIDCERQCKYFLKVIARDQLGTGLKSSSDLIISVNDINDNKPEFHQNYTFRVGPLTKKGTRIGAILAKDKDVSPQNHRVIYLLNDGGYGKFHVDFTSGDLIVSDELLREPVQEEYTLVVEAHDTGEPRQMASTQVTVIVPISKPPVMALDFEFSVPESLTVGGAAGRLKASDPDIGKARGEKLEYFIRNQRVPFVVDKVSGDIRTYESLDREKTGAYVFEAYVKDNGLPPHTATTTVTVNLLDVNDNPPVFSSSTGYQGHVTEDDKHPKYQDVEMTSPISAKDDDVDEKHQNVRYSLSGTGSDLFEIHPVTGDIHVKTNGTIDCEVKCFYNLKVIATDMEGKGLASESPLDISVRDVNDNKPEFRGDRRFKAGRLAPIGTVVGQLDTTDIDVAHKNNRILHFLRAGGLGKFSVDVESGKITVADYLTREPMKEVYTLEVEAHDTGEPKLSSTTTVEITVTLNTMPTTESSASFQVVEQVMVGSVVGQVTAEDPDNTDGVLQNLEYFITDDTVPFKVDSESGLLKTSSSIDRETADSYEFVVYIKDDGVPPFTASTTVTVSVKDINDNPPIFGSEVGYIGTVSEDDTSPRPFQKVLVMPQIITSDVDATEENRRIRYRLKGDGRQWFTIDKWNGTIYVKEPGSMDCESRCSYNLTILAVDKNGKGFETEAPLIISVVDQNDNVPVFEQSQYFNTPRLTPGGTNIGAIIATDSDVTSPNNRINFHLRKGGFGKFSVDMLSGNITVSDSLLREPMRAEYKLYIEAHDSGNPSLSAGIQVTVAVPLNHKPYLPPLSQFSVEENVIIGSEVGQIIAKDEDVRLDNSSETLTYYLGNPSAFVMDEETGMIRTNVNIDREEEDQYVLDVFVKDNGIPSFTSSASLVISVLDQNDHIPVFSRPEGYQGEVTEDDADPIDRQLVKMNAPVIATDEDATEENKQVRFRLEGEGSEEFEMNETTGEVHVKHRGRIDCERTCLYNLTVVAYEEGDNSSSSATNLIITVEDVNDNAPEFMEGLQFQTGRLTSTGDTVGRLDARDADFTDRNNKIIFLLREGGYGKFAVDVETGEILVSDDLTRPPMKEVYELVVEAFDNGDPQLSVVAEIRIHVTLNTPPSVPPAVQVLVQENIPTGTFVTKIMAIDPDIGKNPDDYLDFYINDTAVPFEISVVDGTIRTSAAIDRESQETYTFSVYVRDHGIPAYTVSSSITVHVKDLNDNAPQFGSPVGYNGTLTEDDSYPIPMQEVMLTPLVAAHDNDSTDVNRNLTFTLKGNDSELFLMDRKTAEIRVKKAGVINCEVKCHFDLKIVVTDRGGRGLSTETPLALRVKDTNDNTPRITEKQVFTTGRGASLGTTLGFLSAKDADVAKRNSKILFYLKEGGFQKFAVDFYTGEVLIAANLTRAPMLEEYWLFVELYDTGEPQLSSTAEVLVKVPKNSPPTVEPEITIEVTENGPAGEVVGRVIAQDPDVDKVPGEQLQYILGPGSELAPFNLNHSSGVITSIISHDRELVDGYVFGVRVFDNGLPSFTATTTVTATVLDQNDHVPMFEWEEGYLGTVIEDNSDPILNQRLIVMPEIHVIDKDKTEANRDIRFSLVGKGSDLFDMDAKTGKILVREPGSIDCETWSEFDLTIVATDRGGKGLNVSTGLKVKVEDLNDNAPNLEKEYRFAVGRLTPVGATVGLVKAVDNDASPKNNRVHYSITGGSGSGRFAVDLNSGNITVTSPLTTQPMRDQYSLTLEAYDTGNPSLAAVTKVLVDVPLNTPPTVLPSFYISIYENKDPGTFVGNVSAFDPDVTATSDEKLQYSFNASAVPFSLDRSSGLITTARVLDREVESRFIFPVKIADNGAPPFTVTTTVTVNVWDENDNYPVFSSKNGYSATITENDNSDTYETSIDVTPPISATDLDKTAMNKKIWYSMSGPGSELFTMDGMTGAVQLSGKGPINCEDQCRFHLQITATDRNGTGLQSLTNLTVHVEDVNDNSPKFVQEYEFRLQRLLPVGTVIGTVKARDQDATAKNNRVLYHIKQGSHGDFEIDLMTGDVRIAHSLLREPHTENYLLELEAVDTGNPQMSATTDVKINVPKNHAPLLQSFFEFTVDENLAPDTEVGQVVADDYDVDVADAQNLHYWITEAVPFTVDPLSGIILTDGELDREVQKEYLFSMYVKDDGVPPFTASTTVKVAINDVNDNAPVFGSLRGYKARITEDDTLSVGTQEVDLLPALVVTDADSSRENRNMRFRLKGPGSKHFSISSQTGQIHAKYRQIDCEKRCRYILQLLATDQGGNGTTSMTKILIEVEDVNDHPPMVPGVYSFTTPRLSQVGTEVGKIEAIDRDWTKKNSRLLYYLKDGGHGKFSVNISSGSVYVNTPLVTSPMLEQYVLHVEVYDTGEPQLWALTEVVINVPLNKPPTIQPQYNFTTPENRDLGEIIGEIQATDPDLVFNPSEVLSYYVNDSRLPFSVDLHTGLLLASGSLDLEEDDHFMFPLYVSDNGIPPFTATTTVRVQVLDVNDHYPLFNSIGGYTVSLDEDDQSPRKKQRIKVSPRIMVSDGDETPENREVRFRLTGEGQELFKIDPITADLFVREPGSIDCETQCRFDLKIVAGDQLGVGLESTENLVIHVVDLNDNRPVFPHNYSFSVPRASAIGSSVGTVKAIDDDVTSRNSRILYSIKSSSRGDFVVNIQTGEIVVANSLFLEPQKEDYWLVLEGTDTGDPPLSTETTVKISVPMNHPPILDEEISFAVKEKLQVGAMIGEISAHDIDIGLDLNQYLVFSMENDKVPFLINATSGIVSTSGELDSETAEKYSFEVFVRDNGEPEHTVSSLITIYVTDVNDNAPLFGSKKGYRGLVTEDNWIPLENQEVIVIPPISAEDLDKSADNSAIRFRLEGPGKEAFRIDPRSGDVTIEHPGTIDCEKMCLYDLQVIAEDGEGLTSQTNLTITVEDVNDNGPQFDKPVDLYVQSTTDVGAVVGSFQAKDLDKSTRNNRVMYLLRGGGHGKFAVDMDSGDIIVADSLIREPLMENYWLHIEAYDTGEPRLSAQTEVMVSVAMNHPPTMEIFYAYEVRETVPVGTVVGKVDVLDPDKNQTLEFFMEESEVPFQVSPDTGIIRTSERLDREAHEEHEFKLYVRDNGTPPYTASTTVNIFLEDVNDNYPIFLAGYSYHGYVIEDDFNPKIRQRIQLDKNISVIDRDVSEENRDVVLSLEGEGSDLFVIDKYSGFVSTAKPGTIDREKTAVFNLQVAATDQNGEGLTRRAHLVISVVDENDHPPVFEKPKFLFTLNHLAKAGLEVGHVKAYDPDATKPNNELLYVLQDDPFGKFKLDVRTGKLYLLESFFAKPRRDEYVIQVSVIDMGFPPKTAYTEVVVKSTGMRFNDFPPEFLGRTMFYLREETPVGTLVGKLNIIDKDKNNGGRLNVTIEEKSEPFSVDNSGNIRTTARIDRDAGNFYYLFNVKATDTGNPPMNTSQEIGIIIEDINDNPPEFTLKKYRHMVYDLFPPYTVVATPFAHDTLDTTASVYHYQMTGGKPGYFFIDNETGEVKTTSNVQRLSRETITYTIKATDLYNRALTATTTLEIQILDSFSNTTCCCRVPC